MKRTPTIVGAVDIGATTIKALVGFRQNRELVVLGHAKGSAEGAAEDSSVNWYATMERLHRVLVAAEHHAQASITELYCTRSNVDWATPTGHPFRHCFHVPVTRLLPSAVAAGALVTTAQLRDRGVLVIELGGGASSYALYRAGAAVRVGAIPLGGQHLTKELTLGLRLTLEQAETAKRRFGRGIWVARDPDQKVWLKGDYSIGDRQFALPDIERITSAGVTQLFAAVRAQLGQRFLSARLPAGLVLSGGASQLPGIAAAAEAVFGIVARLGEPPASVVGELRDPSFNAVLGLLHADGGDARTPVGKTP